MNGLCGNPTIPLVLFKTGCIVSAAVCFSCYSRVLGHQVCTCSTVVTFADDTVINRLKGHDNHQSCAINNECPQRPCVQLRLLRLAEPLVLEEPIINSSSDDESDTSGEKTAVQDCFSTEDTVEDPGQELLPELTKLRSKACHKFRTTWRARCVLTVTSPFTWAWLAILLYSLVSVMTDGLKITICDCNVSTRRGVIDLGKYSSCAIPLNSEPRSQRVNYTLYENTDISNTFPGFVFQVVS